MLDESVASFRNASTSFEGGASAYGPLANELSSRAIASLTSTIGSVTKLSSEGRMSASMSEGVAEPLAIIACSSET